MPTSNDCSCGMCREACTEKPGWFLPGEVEKAAELLGVTTDELFRTKLAVDWLESGPDVFVLAPALVGEDAGAEYPSNPSGTCVFYQDGRCEIHAAKPHECRAYHHSEGGAELDGRHRAVADAWAPFQSEITRLLGRDPIASEYHCNSIFGGLFDYLWR